jgi:16S rRNA (cytosine967-C5)-methyltransferase
LVTLDYILGGYLKGGVGRMDPEVRALLRSGLYQCLYMDSVPAAAAVNESVKLCAAFKKRSASGLVNAVLRRAAGFDAADIDAIPNAAERLSVKYSVCRGLADMLINQYRDEAADILAGTLMAAPAFVRVNTLKTDRASLARALEREGITAAQSPADGLMPGLLALKSGRYVVAPQLESGLMRIQGLAAQYAVSLLDPRPGETILDACAAPGGKALTAAQIMENRGRIVALVIRELRLGLLRRQAELEGVTIVEAVCADAASYSPGGAFDAVLCDVPCSGYGEMAQKPELRALDPSERQGLRTVQRDILQNAASLVKKGGRVVYSTCTVDRRENEDIVDGFLRGNGGFEAEKPAAAPPYARAEGKYLKFLPQEGCGEGFFMATLRKMW